jgi:2-succinyl-5-enolpyruvyl-6-hydroxy-3-cyclohexene-1-carboxylate synthase
MIDQQRGIIVAGGGVDDPAAVQASRAALQWPVLADPRSGCRHLPQAVSGFDSLRAARRVRCSAHAHGGAAPR